MVLQILPAVFRGDFAPRSAEIQGDSSNAYAETNRIGKEKILDLLALIEGNAMFSLAGVDGDHVSLVMRD